MSVGGPVASGVTVRDQSTYNALAEALHDGVLRVLRGKAKSPE